MVVLPTSHRWFVYADVGNTLFVMPLLNVDNSPLPTNCALTITLCQRRSICASGVPFTTRHPRHPCRCPFHVDVASPDAILTSIDTSLRRKTLYFL
ncbi:hypothetical protein IC582_025468 [Cucumis melo]